MHPALRSWREELPTSFVRFLAYLGAVALLSIGAAHVSQSPKVMTTITPVHQPDWIEVERPFPAFALSIPPTCRRATLGTQKAADARTS